jgi:hypothetical protein
MRNSLKHTNGANEYGESTVGKLGNWMPDPFYNAFADLG